MHSHANKLTYTSPVVNSCAHKLLAKGTHNKRLADEKEAMLKAERDWTKGVKGEFCGYKVQVVGIKILQGQFGVEDPSTKKI